MKTPNSARLSHKILLFSTRPHNSYASSRFLDKRSKIAGILLVVAALMAPQSMGSASASTSSTKEASASKASEEKWNPITSASTESAIRVYLSQHPEARRYGKYAVSFDNDNVIMNWPVPGTRKVSSDPAVRPDLAAAATDTKINTADSYLQSKASESLTASVAASAGYPNGCPYGTTIQWFCFYQDSYFGGRMLQFKDCKLQDFTNFGFNDAASSWTNTTYDLVKVWRSTEFYDAGPLWTESATRDNPFVGTAANDVASQFRRIC